MTSTRRRGLLLVVAILAAVLGAGPAGERVEAQTPPVLTGELPRSGGFALVSWSGGSVEALADASAARGCGFASVWSVQGSMFLGWVRGAPGVVNEAFLARFAGGQLPSGAYLVVCRAPVNAARAIGGCPLFPDDNPWAADISAYPVHPNSARYLASIAASGGNQFLHADFGEDPSYGIPYVVVPASQPGVPVTFEYASESDAGPYPIPADVPIEAGSDRHALIVREGDCRLYELFALQRSGSGWTAGSGAIFDLRSNALRPDGWTSADAAGLPILPGLVRQDEVRAGAIHHALRFTLRRTQRAYIAPATHYASSITDLDVPPMGLRLRLRADYDISGYRGQARVVLEALRRYGMFVADNGSNWYISGANGPGWDDDDLNQLKRVPGSAFEAVETGPLKTR